MSELNFEDIRPFTDTEALVALKRIADSEMVNSISAYLWPGQDPCHRVGAQEQFEGPDIRRGGYPEGS